MCAWPWSSIGILIVHRLDQPSLGRLQQFGDDAGITAPRLRDLHGDAKINANDLTRWREPELAETGQEDVPGLVLFQGSESVFVIGAEMPVYADFAFGAGRAFLAAPFTVPGPSASPEMPAAKGPDPFFAAFRSTCLSVNS